MKFEFSAGGIVLRDTQDFGSKPQYKKKALKVLVCQHSQHHGWVFPKGLIGDKKKGEGKEVKRKFTESELRNEKTVSELKDAVLALALYSKENNSQKKEELWKEVVKALIALGVSAFTEVQEDMSEAVKEVTS
ncbi:hypothetical protein M1307_03490 [Patescibacteria group bacterium]|nr:hypothetical protein [Patescibacteria group bacterium]